MKAKKKKVKFLKGEKLMYLLLLFIILAIPIAEVCSQALLSESNIKVERLKKDIQKQKNYNESLNFDVEKVKKQISTQEKKNESLNMKISELASLENIETIANELGLSYNNDNIKTVSE